MLISIITPVHNGAAWLSEGIAASLDQTYPAIELLLVDDASTDASRAIMVRAAETDPRVRLFSLNGHRGVSCARNAGIAEAKGDWLCFVDADDMLAPDFCQRLLAAASGAEIAKGIYAYPEGHAQSLRLNAAIKADKDSFCLQFAACLYNTHFLRANNIGFPEALAFSEDLVFCARAAAAAARIGVDDGAQVKINVHAGSRTFGAPDSRAMREHFQALAQVMAIVSHAKGGAFNFVMPALFDLIFRIAAKNPALRARAIQAGSGLGAALGRSSRLDRAGFAANASPALCAALAPLLAGDAAPFFALIDAERAALCRGRFKRL